MNTDRAALLGQPNNMVLHVLTSCHHQVSDFICNDHNERESPRNSLPFLLRLRLQAFHQLLFGQLVIATDMTHTGTGQQAVTFFHFFNGPGQDRFSLLHFGNDRMHKMRQSPIARQFDHFRIDHQHPNFIRTTSHQDRTDNGIQAHTFTGTGPPSDQQVRHGRQVKR